jgi:hypothetical protein
MLICAQYVGENGFGKWRGMVPAGAFCGACGPDGVRFDRLQDDKAAP